ncbi:hypothetical protein GA0115255_101297 [Streptomyces sp. Ncost-T6T-2b]|nr:hypothetical protein GA0115255_101297 [Streptomyces sp. Ncost-T6T-2b]
MTGPETKAAIEWLTSVAPDPGACRWEWERNPQGIALLPAGRRWDVLILPGELGYPTLDVLTRLIDRPGPVLADFGESRMGFFVPPGTVSRWIGTGGQGLRPGNLDRRAVSGARHRGSALAHPAGRLGDPHRRRAPRTRHARGGGRRRRGRPGRP